jgi:hypothetical protein
MLTLAEGENAMFDVYLNGRRDLLVVRRGFPIPVGAASGKWRKSKKRVVCVSEEISIAVQRRGYYMRRLKGGPSSGATGLPGQNRSREYTAFTLC